MSRIVITTETFLEFRFSDPAPGTWILTWHPHLEQFDEYRQSIILGVCEVLVGATQMGLSGTHSCPVNLPPDYGQHGYCDCDFDLDGHTVFVRNLITSTTPIQIISPVLESDSHLMCRIDSINDSAMNVFDDAMILEVISDYDRLWEIYPDNRHFAWMIPILPTANSGIRLAKRAASDGLVVGLWATPFGNYGVGIYCPCLGPERTALNEYLHDDDAVEEIYVGAIRIVEMGSRAFTDHL